MTQLQKARAAHRPNAPVTKPELVSYDVAGRLSSRCDGAKIGYLVLFSNFIGVLF
jgi:hypothetical protein